MYIINTVHLVGIKKVFDAIKNAKNRKLSNTSWDNQCSCCDLHHKEQKTFKYQLG
jgi:hypothetical protein